MNKHPNEHSIVEPIGRAWQDELVSLPLSTPGPARVVNGATGARLPSQVSGDAVWTRVSLRPNERLGLCVEQGEAVGGSGFTFDEAGATTVISNGRIAVRVPKSGAFDAGKAPGPILSISRDGQWIGQGHWGESATTGRIETTVTDRGPLFAAWLTRYIVGGRELARYQCTLHDGEDFVRVRDRTSLGAGMAFRFLITGRDAPKEWFTYGGGEAVNVARGPMDQPPPRKGRYREGEFIHIDYHSGHFQMSYSWVGFTVGHGTAIMVGELCGGRQEIPGRNRIRVFRADDGVELVFPADGGSKEFALVCGDPAVYAPENGLSGFCHLRRRHSDIPLEKVRHWVTDWPLRRQERPTLYPPETAERWREKLESWPELAAAYQNPDLSFFPAQLVVYLIRDEPALREKLIRQMDAILDESIEHVFTNGYLRLIIFTGRQLKNILEVIDVLRWRNELDEPAARSFARRAAFLAYCFADNDFWPWDSVFRDREDPRSIGEEYWDDIGGSVCPPNFTTEYYTTFGLVALAYPEHPAASQWRKQAVELFERNLAFYFYESGAYAESVNYHAHELIMLTHLAIALMAAGDRDFFEHPRFKATFGSLLDTLTPPSVLTAAGLELATAANMLNPPRDGRDPRVMLTNWGNSGRDCSAYVVPVTLAVAAGVYVDRDPSYARRLMTAWRSGAQEFCTHYLALHLVAMGRPDLEDVDLNLGSTLVEGLGAVMRAGNIFAWVKCGTASHHNCRDEGGLVLYAHGAPVIGDLGYQAVHEGRTEGVTDTWKHACVTFGGKRISGYLGTEIRQPPELWRSTPEADLLVAYLPIEYLVPDRGMYLDIEPIPRIEHRRFILFVKPFYFVIYDHIPRTTLPSSWWMHALADSVKLSPAPATGRARFQGRFGVDLDIQVLLPSPAKISEGVYSVQRHIRIDLPGAGDYLTVLTPLLAGIEPALAAWNSENHCLTIKGEWGADHVFLSGDDRRFQHEGKQYLGRVVLLRNGVRILGDR